VCRKKSCRGMPCDAVLDGTLRMQRRRYFPVPGMQRLSGCEHVSEPDRGEADAVPDAPGEGCAAMSLQPCDDASEQLPHKLWHKVDGTAGGLLANSVAAPPATLFARGSLRSWSWSSIVKQSTRSPVSKFWTGKPYGQIGSKSVVELRSS
jgi:hypothetical protein